MLMACVVGQCGGEAMVGRRGHPRAELMRVLATLHRFLREGTPWRSLRASGDQVSGSTLRRTLARWAEHDVLGRAHRLVVGLLRRPGREVIVDSRSVRAKRRGELTGPNPTDKGKHGTKCHLAVTRGGLPVAYAATGANVKNTMLCGNH